MTENRREGDGVKREQAALLWRLLDKKTRRKVAEHLELSELQELNRLYAEHQKRPAAEKRRAQERLIKDTRRGFNAWPTLASLVLALTFVGLFAAHLVFIPRMKPEPRFYVFAPLFLGVLAPLTLYILPGYRIRALFRLLVSPRALTVAFAGFMALLWVTFFINVDGAAMGFRSRFFLNQLVLAIGVATAPLLEEIIFREVIPGMFAGAPERVGHIIASLLFAAAHAPGSFESFDKFMLYFLSGLILAEVRMETNGLLYPLAAHAGSNVTHQLFF